jgi:hypothetical protein
MPELASPGMLSGYVVRHSLKKMSGILLFVWHFIYLDLFVLSVCMYLTRSFSDLVGAETKAIDKIHIVPYNIPWSKPDDGRRHEHNAHRNHYIFVPSKIDQRESNTAKTPDN